MASGDEDRGGRRRGKALILAASARLYGALLALYPEVFRRRYASEMRRDFRELSREGLEEGGGIELARVWGTTLSDLVVTALGERSTMLARNASLSIDPRIAARATMAVVFVAVTVTVTSSVKTPQYEASTTILIGKQDSEQPALEVDAQELQGSAMTLASAADSRPMAEDAIGRLGLSTTPEEFLERLDVERIEDTQFVEVSYTDPDPQKARAVANTLGDLLSERVPTVNTRSNDAINAALWESARLPEKPSSPNPLRDGLLTLVSGLLLCAALALVLPRILASGIGRAAIRATGRRVAPVGESRGASAKLSAAEAAKEKELLEALARRGALTVAGATLETSLTVEEADRALSALAAKGHLEVTVEHGRLLYALWERDAPLGGP
jgi:capsular polysaccharide biosynthesis protein